MRRYIEVQARDQADLDAAFEGATSAHADGLIVGSDSAFLSSGSGTANDPVFVLPLRYRLPTMYSQIDTWVDNGGLMAYGPDVTDTHRRAATYVDKILKGVSPADLPVEQSMAFDFAINVKTLRALGLTIPASVLPVVTEWIQ